jgi:hypothetical protein
METYYIIRSSPRHSITNDLNANLSSPSSTPGQSWWSPYSRHKSDPVHSPINLLMKPSYCSRSKSNLNRSAMQSVVLSTITPWRNLISVSTDVAAQYRHSLLPGSWIQSFPCRFTDTEIKPALLWKTHGKRPNCITRNCLQVVAMHVRHFKIPQPNLEPLELSAHALTQHLFQRGHDHNWQQISSLLLFCPLHKPSCWERAIYRYHMKWN